MAGLLEGVVEYNVIYSANNREDVFVSKNRTAVLPSLNLDPNESLNKAVSWISRP